MKKKGMGAVNSVFLHRVTRVLLLRFSSALLEHMELCKALINHDQINPFFKNTHTK